jgi:hypothetical protein
LTGRSPLHVVTERNPTCLLAILMTTIHCGATHAKGWSSRSHVTVPNCGDILRYTGKTVGRGCVVGGQEQANYEQRSIPLAVCGKCGRSVRVLPCDLLPYKTYSLPVIQQAMQRYLTTDMSLRKSVHGIVTTEQHAPRHSSLHRWLGGLGEKLLDRNKWIATAYPPSTCAVLAQTGRMLSLELPTLFLHSSPPRDLAGKYRSERRYEQLRAVACLLSMASDIALGHESLCRWQQLLLDCFFVPAWNFPSAFPATSMQQARPP